MIMKHYKTMKELIIQVVLQTKVLHDLQSKFSALLTGSLTI